MARVTPRASLDDALGTLGANKDRWACLPVADKAALLDQSRSKLRQVAQPWVDASVRAKQLDPPSPWVGEEWVSGPGPSPRASTVISTRCTRSRTATRSGFHA